MTQNSERFLTRADFWKFVAMGVIQTAGLVGGILYSSATVTAKLSFVESRLAKVENRLDNLPYPFDLIKQQQFEDMRIDLESWRRTRDKDLKDGRLQTPEEKKALIREVILELKRQGVID